MNIARIGLDLAKHDFQGHGVGRQEKALRPAARLRPQRAAGDEPVYTQAFAGCFNDNDQFRQEFLRSISGRMP